MPDGRARPENTHVVFDLRVIHTAVVHDGSFRSLREFSKDVLRHGVWKVVAASETICQVDENLPIEARIARGSHGLGEPHAAALAGGYRAIVFFLKRSGKDDIRMM